ncbi:MAG: vitamin B12-dependent ribonucleotide reductase, partial [Armatimonadetes bacterium]|nr:vitamin B12-dependent ribonucleotide reductase [Armatimonadota bacterium]
LGHLKMMAAVQPFLSGAISKTINLPRDATVEDVEQCFRQAWKLGLKCVTVYRDGSKSSQPVSASKDKRSEGTGQASGLEREKEPSRPAVLAEDQQVIVPFSINHTRTRVRLPDTRKAITHKFSISGHEGYFTVGLYDDGSPGELFVKIAKEGSTISGMMDMVGLLVSMALQWGVPLKSIITKLKGMHFEPSGWTQNPNIHFAKSIADYLARWLEIQFVDEQQPLLFPGDGHEDRHEKAAPALSGKESGELPALDLSDSGPPCPDCGALMVPNGTCYQCLNCGVTSGCS